MKKPALLAVIIICLIVFISSLSAGIVLTFSTVGWSGLMDSSQLQDRLKNLVGSLEDLSPGIRQSLSIDETKTMDLIGIDSVRISSLSENITLTTGGSQVTARLAGSYRTMGSPITWIVEKKGNELLIHADYPRWGLTSNDLAMQIQVPAEYAGEVRISTMSGNCELPDLAEYRWSLFQYNGMSGSLKIAQASLRALRFSSISGSVDLSGCTGKISGDTVSGNLNLSWKTFGESSIKTISGQVRLALPATADCLLSFKTVSGSFRNSSLPIQISMQEKRRIEGKLNQGILPLNVETVSGDLVMSES